MANPNINPLVSREKKGVQVTSVDVAYTDDGDDITIGTFPAGTVIESVTVVTTTAFDSGTSDVVSVGLDSDTDSVVNDEDIQAAGTVSATVIDAGRYISTEDVLVAAYVSAGTAPTAGAATVVVKWVVI